MTKITDEHLAYAEKLWADNRTLPQIVRAIEDHFEIQVQKQALAWHFMKDRTRFPKRSTEEKAAAIKQGMRESRARLLSRLAPEGARSKRPSP